MPPYGCITPLLCKKRSVFIYKQVHISIYLQASTLKNKQINLDAICENLKTQTNLQPTQSDKSLHSSLNGEPDIMVSTQVLEDWSLYHLYSFKTKSLQYNYLMTVYAFGFEVIEVIKDRTLSSCCSSIHTARTITADLNL